MKQVRGSLTSWASKSLVLSLFLSALWLTLPTQAQVVNPDLLDPGLRKAEIEQRNALLPPAVEPTEQIIISLRPGVNARDFARRYGLQALRAFRSDPSTYVFRASSDIMAQVAVAAVRNDTRVTAAYVNMRTSLERDAFVPNDPFFLPNVPEFGWQGQWHLWNSFVPGRDVSVSGAWARDLTGAGVIIGIVDDGFQYDHPDLSPNYSATNSFDFGQNDADPAPVTSEDNHGTAGAGVAAARGGNGIGGTGAAPLANFAGLRVDFLAPTSAMFSDATLYRSNTAGSPVKVKSHSYGTNTPFVATQAEFDALTTSINAGTIHLLSAGNGRGTSGQDANKRHTAAHPGAIVVAALGSNGVYANYSNYGANVFITAPSGSDFPNTDYILTTDRLGDLGLNAAGFNPGMGDYDLFPDADYTSIAGGTSAATALAAGVLALGKQAQPALNARFAKHILAMSGVVVHPNDNSAESDGGWKTNASNYRFNQNYGFGLLDAEALTRLATHYTGVTGVQTFTIPTLPVNVAIPDNNATGVSRSFLNFINIPVEVVRVTLGATHPYRGDLEAYLTSPRGTTTRLFSRSATDSDDNISWTFTTNAFWGENPQGTWTVNVRDVSAGNTGTWTQLGMEFQMGRLVAVPALTNLTPNFVPVGSGAFTLIVNGTGFTPVTSLTWAGATLVTTFHPPSQLWAAIPAANLTTKRTVEIRATTPNPGGTSGPMTFTVGLRTTLNADNQTGRLGQTVPLTATLRRLDTAAPVAGATLTFRIEGASVGTAATDASGVATLNYAIPNTGAGNKAITVEYAGDAAYFGSTASAALVIPVLNTLSTVSNVTGAIGQTVQLRAGLRRFPDGVVLSGRTFTFKINGEVVGTAVTAANGVASLNYAIPVSLGAGMHTLLAEFAGDGDYNASSKTATLTTKFNTLVTVNNATGRIGQNIQLRATLRRFPDAMFLQGKTLTFKVDGVTVGSAVVGTDNLARLPYQVPEGTTEGTHTLTVEFAGDTEYNPASQNGTLEVSP